MAYKIQFDNGYTVEFDSQPNDSDIDEAYAHTKTLGKPKGTAGLGTAIATSFANVGNMADTAFSTLGGSALALVGDSKEALQVREDMEARNKQRLDWANPNKEELGLGGKLIGAAATLPMQIAAMGLSPASTVKTLKDAGETNTKATWGGIIDAAGNALGIAAPVSLAAGPAMRGLSGFAFGAGQEAATKKLIKEIANTKEGKEAFQPTWEDATVAGLTGGTMGFAFGPKGGQPKQSKKASPDLSAIAKEMEALKPKEEAAPLVDTRKGPQLSKEAYEAALREKELQRTSAFNRPDQFPDMVQETPMDRMVRDLGGKPESLIENDGSALGRMAEDVTAERGPTQLDLELTPKPEVPFELTRPEGTAPAMPPREVVKTRLEDPLLLERTPDGGLGEVRPIETPSVAPTTRETATDKVANGQYFKLSAEERVYWEKTRKVVEAVSDGLKSLSNKDILNKIMDREWVQRTVDKIKQQQEMFREVETRSQDRKAVQMAEKKREVLEDQLVALQEHLSPARPDTSRAQQGPKTRAEQRKNQPIGQRGFANKQTGAVMLPFGKKPAIDQLKKVAGIKDKLRNVFPEGQSIPDVIAEHAAKKTPDISQNSIQRLMNHLTKGSLYQTIKTDNPILRVVGEKIRQANNYAMEATGRLIHDNLAPKARALSKQEKADVWAVQQLAESKGVTLTPEFLRNEGFNQKQIDWVTEHKAVMDDMYTRLGASMEAAGVKPVSARVAYIASKARGDFRKLIMKDDKVVGIMGDNTRAGLDKQVARLLKDHPEYKAGEERYYGGRKAKGTEEGFTQMLDFLSKEDPNLKLFVQHVNDMLSQDAFNYMNAKSHTMQKKGVFGMEGRKLYADAAKNAEEGMQAQIRYAETMIKWSELSKAIAELKPLLKADNGLDMPMAKQWSNEYIQGALGNSPGRLGDALDSVTAAAGKLTGWGTTIPSKVISTMKQYVNGALLGFANPGFLLANILQAPRTMPEMATWLKTKGVDTGVDLGIGRSLITLQKDMLGMKLTDLETQALDYAKKNHVYSSNLFESGNTVSKDLTYYWQKGTQFIASDVERVTRKMTFFAYTHMLDASGVKPKDGLFEAAQNLTDMHMNNYAQAEAPRVYQETGGIGRSAYNLMSFKHNELSRLAMFAREIPAKEGRPILVAMASQVAFAGLMGTLLFAEADALYELITAKMGEPSSLTKVLLDNPEISDNLKFGMGAMADVDMTSRMGLQLTPGSVVDLMAPGAGKLVDIAGAAGQLAGQPNMYNAANLAREVLPLSVGGIMDRTIFETGDGMALNRNKVSASAVRNNADKLWKSLGMTGLNESVQKKLSYENQKIDEVYKEKRSKVIDGAIKEYYMRGVLPENWVERYVELQGDPKEAARAITERIEALNVDRPTKEVMKNAASKSVTSQHKLLRRLGME